MTSHERYYVPAWSKWPIITSIGPLVTVSDLGIWFDDLTADHKGSHDPWTSFVGGLIIAYMLFGRFGNIIRENRAGFYNTQMGRSFRWDMSWLIFSEVMFFVAFFGALFYVRHFADPWLGGEGAKDVAHILRSNFQCSWPLLQTPDPKLFPPPNTVIEPRKLPLISTILLVTSSFAVTFTHHALEGNKRDSFRTWLVLTMLLGVASLILRAEEYVHAYSELGLTFGAGIHGSTFFVLTGFHGAHVTLSALILGIMLVRILRGHFDARHHFGFEAASWYWYLVNAAWISLFIFAYVV